MACVRFTPCSRPWQVFRNQALKAKTEKKRFINSTIHSDFHR